MKTIQMKLQTGNYFGATPVYFHWTAAQLVDFDVYCNPNKPWLHI